MNQPTERDVLRREVEVLQRENALLKEAITTKNRMLLQLSIERLNPPVQMPEKKTSWIRSLIEALK